MQLYQFSLHVVIIAIHNYLIFIEIGIWEPGLHFQCLQAAVGFQLAVANICGGKPDPGRANPSNCKRLLKMIFSHGCACNKCTFLRRIGFFGLVSAPGR